MRRTVESMWIAGLLLIAACGDDGGGQGGAAGDGGAGSTATSTSTSTSTSTTTSTTTSTSTSTTTSTATSTSTATTNSTAGAGGDGGAGGGGNGGAGGDGDGGAGGDGDGGAGGDGGSGAGGPLPGYGEIAGSCGEIDDADLLDPDPSFHAGSIDLSGEDPITLEDPEGLTPGAQEMIADGNLGGSSLWSEVFAFEVLARCEGATLIKSEAEIVYDDVGGKKTDILVDIDGMKVGVSVVRAVGFPPEDPYTVDDALPVLEGKLDDILLSSENVSDGDAWVKQILSVVAYSDEHAASMEEAWEMLDDATRADTIVFITVTDGEDTFVYFED